ncbi:MAG: 7-cyano-7-deazaguanine synthase [Deltaproteobacteria bacterium]|nr:7-cyano-7-deazaguanine synthase [Deltaproteobacteria bacterium]
MTKAVALLSGGLDSTLAVKLMLDQGIEVCALNFTSAFCTCNSGGRHKAEGKEHGGCRSEARNVAEKFNIPIKVLAKGLDYMEVVRNPRHGYGKGINPCVDCRVYMFSLAKKYMEETGASFIITGEVLGQRPMSQRRDTFRIIEKESGLIGLILRPLSAKHLEPTIPEINGLVDRAKLLDMAGRTRRPQMELADDLRVEDYPCPSGGCLLTDKIFSKKVRDLLDHKNDITTKDLHTLKIGRHFRHNGVKLVVSRNESENAKLKLMAQPGDAVLEPIDFSGPVAVVAGNGRLNGRNAAVDMAARLILRYASSSSKSPGGKSIRVTDGEQARPAGGPSRTAGGQARPAGGPELIVIAEPADDETIEEIRVC